MQKIKIILLTGFLGAGKTTLLKSILDEYDDKKIGIVINEFGKINIDARLVEKNGVEMAEVSNGSIFCSCLKENFVNSLIEMSKLDLEYIFIEASGLADPSSMTMLIENMKNKLVNPFDYKGALCVIDGEHFMELQEVLPALANQIEFSKYVLINKVDLINEETIEKIENVILKINPTATIVPTVYCKMDYSDAIARLSDVNTEGRESTNTVDSRPRSFSLKVIKTVEKEPLTAFLKVVGKHAYRIKGFINTPEGNIEISCVGDTVQLLPWEKEVPLKEIVVISAIGPKIIKLIVDAMAEHLNGEITF